MHERRVALVTGASRGIGYAIAKRLGEKGHDLAICGTRAQTIEKAAASLRPGGEVLAMAVDVSRQDEVQAMVAEVLKTYGRLDVLVNNAGITRDTLALRMSQEDWRQVIDTNLSSVFYTSQAVLKPMMKARFGRIINISSVVAAMGNPGQINYCASKGGIDALTRALAREVGARGITVNAVAPGFIATDMTAKMNEAAKQQLRAQIPAGRLGDPEDIAHAVAFLASEEAAYITGQVLHVNGGMYM